MPIARREAAKILEAFPYREFCMLNTQYLINSIAVTMLHMMHQVTVTVCYMFFVAASFQLPPSDCARHGGSPAEQAPGATRQCSILPFVAHVP